MSFWQSWGSQRRLRIVFAQLYAETVENMERFYVMFQLGRLRMFELEEWTAAAGEEGVKIGEDFRSYIKASSDYNTALADFQDFERWYSADSANKTRDNAVELHRRKQHAQDYFDKLEPVIRSGLLDLENDLMLKGWLKHRSRYTQRLAPTRS